MISCGIGLQSVNISPDKQYRDRKGADSLFDSYLS